MRKRWMLRPVAHCEKGCARWGEVPLGPHPVFILTNNSPMACLLGVNYNDYYEKNNLAGNCHCFGGVLLAQVVCFLAGVCDAGGAVRV